jgi:hypothetical protein
MNTTDYFTFLFPLIIHPTNLMKTVSHRLLSISIGYNRLNCYRLLSTATMATLRVKVVTGVRLYVKCLLFLADCNKTWIFSTDE